MRANSDRRKQERRGTVLSVAAVLLIEVLYLLLWLWLWPLFSGSAAGTLLILIAVIGNLAVIAGVLAAFRQRKQEWKEDEEHDAGQY